MIYVFVILGAIFSHGYAFYQGYSYADTYNELQKAQRYIEELERQKTNFEQANQQSQIEANEANQWLEVNKEVVRELELKISLIQDNPICVDKEILDLLRKSRQ